MARRVSLGIDNFEEMIQNKCFYIDKTDFIKEWWEQGDKVTLITRPRRFGKTLNMSMLECFFSNQYENRSDLFEGLTVWNSEEYRKIQGSYPVIALSFAGVKTGTYEKFIKRFETIIWKLYGKYEYLAKDDKLTGLEIRQFKKLMDTTRQITEENLAMSLQLLASCMYKAHGKKAIIILDEYDTPMQEAYVQGYWSEIVAFTRDFFNNTFKTNPYIERAIMTGITRVSRESIFSDFNNVRVVTTTSEVYETAFGFTEQEVFAALEEQGLINMKQKVKEWYDGFCFGKVRDIYNPWSILGFMQEKKFAPYWTNTSSNSLINLLIQQGDKNIKITLEELLAGKSFKAEIDEQIVYSQLDDNQDAIWSLLLASGYMKVESCVHDLENRRTEYCFSLTNLEVRKMFEKMVLQWFGKNKEDYNGFIKAMLDDDLEAMNEYMNDVALGTFSFFDTGKEHSQRHMTESFYHGFVLGMMVELRESYVLTSNRESGYGRYDVMLEPQKNDLNAIIMEFKVFNSKREKSLEETVDAALRQIEEKRYDKVLIDKGFHREDIRQYGFAFEGKNVLIGTR